MKIAFFGDVVGRPGRRAVMEYLPGVRDALSLDFVVVNAENAAGGFGLTRAIADDLLDAGADCLTLGDHAWDQREIVDFIDDDPRIVRPSNYPARANAPGRGSHLYVLPDGRRVGVIQLQGNVFMRQTLENPFISADAALDELSLGRVCDALIVDMHCEATSEKMAMGHYCDGRASIVVGSHTHVPTADHMILAGGTAYQSDAGMCGDYDSVIGMRKDISLNRFETQLMSERYQPAGGQGTLAGLYVETDDDTGLAVRVAPSERAENCLKPCPFELTRTADLLNQFSPVIGLGIEERPDIEISGLCFGTGRCFWFGSVRHPQNFPGCRSFRWSIDRCVQAGKVETTLKDG
ncbi:MAG: TIGR00282 family metallophosphoesterase [Pseudomonadota bacterium]